MATEPLSVAVAEIVMLEPAVNEAPAEGEVIDATGDELVDAEMLIDALAVLPLLSVALATMLWLPAARLAMV